MWESSSAIVGNQRPSGTLKRRMVAACAACLAADGTVTARGAERLRLVEDYLGCPLPPFVEAPGWEAVGAT